MVGVFMNYDDELGVEDWMSICVECSKLSWELNDLMAMAVVKAA